MKNVVNWENLESESLFDQLSHEIQRQKQLEKEEAIETFDPDELDEQLESIDFDYSTFQNKVMYANSLSSLDVEKQNKSMNILKAIDNNEEFGKYQRLVTMIGYLDLARSYPRLTDMNMNDILLLSSITSSFEIDDYVINTSVLVEDNVLSALNDKTDNFYDKKDLGLEVIQLVDDLMENYGIDESNINTNYSNVLANDCVDFIHSYHFSQQK